MEKVVEKFVPGPMGPKGDSIVGPQGRDGRDGNSGLGFNPATLRKVDDLPTNIELNERIKRATMPFGWSLHATLIALFIVACFVGGALGMALGAIH